MATRQQKVELAYRPWLDDLYKSWGYSIERIKGEKNKFYDVILRSTNERIKVEEKGEVLLSSNMPFEWWQYAEKIDVRLYKRAMTKVNNNDDWFMIMVKYIRELRKEGKSEKHVGWVFKTRADWIIYVFWNMKKGKPFVVYRIPNWLEVFRWFRNNWNYPYVPSYKGSGETWNRLVPWRILDKQGLCKDVYGKPMDSRSYPKKKGESPEDCLIGGDFDV